MSKGGLYVGALSSLPNSGGTLHLSWMVDSDGISISTPSIQLYQGDYEILFGGVQAGGFHDNFDLNMHMQNVVQAINNIQLAPISNSSPELSSILNRMITLFEMTNADRDKEISDAVNTAVNDIKDKVAKKYHDVDDSIFILG